MSKNKFSKEYKLAIINSCKEEKLSIREIASKYGVNRETIYDWIFNITGGNDTGTVIRKGNGTPLFGGRIPKKVTSFSDGYGRLSRIAPAALSFELKEKFRLKDVLRIVGNPESSYHYHEIPIGEFSPRFGENDSIHFGRAQRKLWLLQDSTSIEESWHHSEP